MGRLIKRLRVMEVSLAKYPKNRKRFLLIKDGGVKMDKLAALIAMLVQKADVPEVVKEELKDFGDELSPEDIIEALKEAGVEIELAKDDEGDDDLKDVPEPVKKEMEEMRKLLKEQEAARKELEMRLFKEELAKKVGDEMAEELAKLYGRVEKDVIEELSGRIEGLQKAIEELGGKKGKKADAKDDDVVRDEEVLAEAKKLAEERGISVADALFELASERPDLVAKWQ